MSSVGAGAAWAEVTADEARGLAVDGVAPRYVARPADSQELAEALRQASEAGLAVAPRGGGTQVALGNPPARLDVVVETAGLARVVEYEPADLTVTVEAGLRLADLQALLRAEGQHLALDPPVGEAATIGGVVATNASGPLRYGFGTARDLVIGTRVANADGRLTRAGGRVVKNVAGYDLNKLYVGSLGTVGVIVELSFKVAPIPPREALVAARFPSLAETRPFVDAVIHSPLNPLAVETLAPEAAAHVGLGGASEAGALALVRVGGYESAVARQVRDLAALAERHGGAVVDADDDVWQRARGLADAAGRDVLVRAGAPIARAAEVGDILRAGLAAYAPLVWARAGSGVVYAACAGGDDPTTLAAALEGCRRRVTALGEGSSLVVERCPTGLKAGFDVWGDPGQGIGLMRALKQRLDPRGTLNPGRYVGGI